MLGFNVHSFDVLSVVLKNMPQYWKSMLFMPKSLVGVKLN